MHRLGNFGQEVLHRQNLRILLILWPRSGHKINGFPQDYGSLALVLIVKNQAESWG